MVHELSPMRIPGLQKGMWTPHHVHRTSLREKQHRKPSSNHHICSHFTRIQTFTFPPRQVSYPRGGEKEFTCAWVSTPVFIAYSMRIAEFMSTHSQALSTNHETQLKQGCIFMASLWVLSPSDMNHIFRRVANRREQR